LALSVGNASVRATLFWILFDTTTQGVSRLLISDTSSDAKLQEKEEEEEEEEEEEGRSQGHRY